ncbi:snaclec bitiscetin subunit alpha-like, partial [Homarus americanus]|uniref:snaclec bitiscetin subunit alpha-like n=1 Tax=Homarus americanus TaxID=6706 RepID=UPI001C47CD57
EYDRSGYTTPTPPTTMPPTYFCADGWTRRGESCYQVYPQASSWGDGEKYCAAFSGHLTSIGSDAEEAIIKLLPGMTDIKATYNSVWVGLKLGSDSDEKFDN